MIPLVLCKESILNKIFKKIWSLQTEDYYRVSRQTSFENTFIDNLKHSFNSYNFYNLENKEIVIVLFCIQINFLKFSFDTEPWEEPSTLKNNKQ